MGLFGNREDKDAAEAVAEAEVQRLLALPRAELAVAVLPGLGPGGAARSGHDFGAREAAQWLLSPTSAKVRHFAPLVAPAGEALQLLEHAGLIRAISPRVLTITQLGETALAEGTTAGRLAVPAAPPAPDAIAQLERLAALHASGALTDAEFAAQKQRVLDAGA